MIQLTRLNHVPLIVKSDLIEHIEVTPDTVITLTNGQRFIVLESSDEVVDKVLTFRRAILQPNTCPLLNRTSEAMADEGKALSEAAKTHGR